METDSVKKYFYRHKKWQWEDQAEKCQLISGFLYPTTYQVLLG